MKQYFYLLLLLSPLSLLAQRSYLRIYAKDAAQHVGEVDEVIGYIYGVVIKPDPFKSENKMALLYMGGNYPDNKFTIVIKDINSEGQTWLKALKTTRLAKDKVSLNEPVYGASGKIFLYNDKPAVEIKLMTLGC